MMNLLKEPVFKGCTRSAMLWGVRSYFPDERRHHTLGPPRRGKKVALHL